LATLETTRGRKRDAPIRHRPLFVVGAPRSGSTLLYQLLVRSFDVAYLSNLHCRFYGAPALVERLARGRIEPPPTYTSAYGSTKGARAPSECGEYWYRFFRHFPQYVPLPEADPASLARLRMSVRALGDAAERPIVFKNLICSLRLEPIGAALPEALFVFIRRDLVDNATSILAARHELRGDYSTWWSAEPPEIEDLRVRPAHEQVVEQVRRIERIVEGVRARLAGRFLDVRYAEVCDDPRATMARVREFAADRGLPLAHRGEIPARFEPQRGPPIDEQLRERLVAYIHTTTPA